MIDRRFGVSVSGIIDILSSYDGANLDLFTREVPGTPPPPPLHLLLFWEEVVTDLPMGRSFLWPSPSTVKAIDHLAGPAPTMEGVNLCCIFLKA